MTAAVEEVRAMLALFVASQWRDLHVRSGGWELFLAKPGGAANPMIAAGEVEEQSLGTIDAPHLGVFVIGPPAGTVVVAGTAIGRIEVLGEREDILAGRAGRIAAVLVDDGALVEYGTPLVRLAA